MSTSEPDLTRSTTISGPVQAAINAWTGYRQPDAVRAAALANAVDLSSNWTWDEPEPARVVEMVVLMAERFERYLTGGQGADGPTDPR
jgi:hypothetical protein